MMDMYSSLHPPFPPSLPPYLGQVQVDGGLGQERFDGFALSSELQGGR